MKYAFTIHIALEIYVYCLCKQEQLKNYTIKRSGCIKLVLVSKTRVLQITVIIYTHFAVILHLRGTVYVRTYMFLQRYVCSSVILTLILTLYANKRL